MSDKKTLEEEVNKPTGFVPMGDGLYCAMSPRYGFGSPIKKMMVYDQDFPLLRMFIDDVKEYIDNSGGIKQAVINLYESAREKLQQKAK